ncbi:hypothetical protein LEMLEM_LOCUS12481 [Lemmus lemmus]
MTPQKTQPSGFRLTNHSSCQMSYSLYSLLRYCFWPMNHLTNYKEYEGLFFLGSEEHRV